MAFTSLDCIPCKLMKWLLRIVANAGLGARFPDGDFKKRTRAFITLERKGYSFGYIVLPMLLRYTSCEATE